MSILTERNAQIMALPNVPQAIPLLTKLAQQPDPTNPMQQTLALMKLNEIKRLQAGMQVAQQPQGTVKDQTIQQVAQNAGGVAQLQNARMQQGLQQMAQQVGASAKGAVPSGVGQAPVQAASGGIIRLASGSAVPESSDDEQETPAPEKKRIRTSGQVMLENLKQRLANAGVTIPEALGLAANAPFSVGEAAGEALSSVKAGPQVTYAYPEEAPSIYASADQWAKYRAAKPAIDAQKRVIASELHRMAQRPALWDPSKPQAASTEQASTDTAPDASAPSAAPTTAKDNPFTPSANTSGTAPTARVRPTGTRSPAAAPSPAQRAGLISLPEAAATDYGKQLLESARKAGEQPDYTEVNKMRQGVIDMQNAQLEALRNRESEARARFEKTQNERSAQDVMNAFMAAGEATRGVKGGGRGILAALGGYGQSLGGASEAARQREDAHIAAMEARQDAQQKLAQATAELRLAYATGDVERIAAAQAAKQKAEQEALKTLTTEQGQTQRNAASNATQLEATRMNNATQLAAANIRADSGGAGGSNKELDRQIAYTKAAIADLTKQISSPGTLPKQKQELLAKKAALQEQYAKLAGVPYTPEVPTAPVPGGVSITRTPTK